MTKLKIFPSRPLLLLDLKFHSVTFLNETHHFGRFINITKKVYFFELNEKNIYPEYPDTNIFSRYDGTNYSRIYLLTFMDDRL